MIKTGAEAEIHLGKWLDRPVVEKLRIAKRYRHSAIDAELRRSRTKSESKLLAEVKRYGVAAPIVYEVDLDAYKIIMQYVEGERIKDMLNDITPSKRNELCYKIGLGVARMHEHDIIHGDLTTSNMILFEEHIYFIDFGLGEKNITIEAKGVDLHLLNEAFKSAHSEVYEAFSEVLRGYGEYEEAEAVLKKMKDIEKRGRYA